MSQQDGNHFSDLLTTFDAIGLGKGDRIAGSNVLAAMAVTLANLAPADGTVVTRDGRPARLGASLLATGSASTGLVIDEVGRCQSNIAAHLRHYIGLIEEQSQKMGATPLPMNPGSGAVDDLVGETQSECGSLYSTRAECWAQIMGSAPSESVLDLAASPKILVSAGSPGQLESGLTGLRKGHPLVHLGVGRPDDLIGFADTGAALIEGRYPVGDGCETVRANLLVTDPTGAVGGAVKSPDGSGAWLGHFLWLADGDAAPAPPVDAGTVDPDAQDTVAERFRDALGQVLALRMNLPEKRPMMLPLSTRDAAFGWTAFLRDTEPRLPGISFAARNLIESLVFGLTKMSLAGDEKPPLRITVAGVEALARYLVRRMAGARASMLHAAELAHRRAQIARVFNKLSTAATPIPARAIYRGLSRLPADDCWQCLIWLEAEGLAQRAGDNWQLVEGAHLNFDDSTTPMLLVA